MCVCREEGQQCLPHRPWAVAVHRSAFSCRHSYFCSPPSKGGIWGYWPSCTPSVMLLVHPSLAAEDTPASLANITKGSNGVSITFGCLKLLHPKDQVAILQLGQPAVAFSISLEQGIKLLLDSCWELLACSAAAPPCLGEGDSEATCGLKGAESLPSPLLTDLTCTFDQDLLRSSTLPPRC